MLVLLVMLLLLPGGAGAGKFSQYTTCDSCIVSFGSRPCSTN